MGKTRSRMPPLQMRSGVGHTHCSRFDLNVSHMLAGTWLRAAPRHIVAMCVEMQLNRGVQND